MFALVFSPCSAYPCYVMHLKNLQSLERLITHEEVS